MTTPKLDLMPCPFCGSKPVRPFCYRKTQGEKWGAVVCGNCESYGPEVRTRYGDPEAMDGWGKDADAEWNRRAAPAPAPSVEHRERAEAFLKTKLRMYNFDPAHFYTGRDVDDLAAEFAAVREEARPKPNSTDKAVVDALIDRHKGLPGSSDEWCICLSDQFRHDLEVIMAAVREAATKAERERCAKIADKYYNEQMAFAQNWPNRPTGIPDTGAAIRRKP